MRLTKTLLLAVLALLIPAGPAFARGKMDQLQANQ